MKILKKIGAIFLVVTFLIGVLPVTASAASIPTQVMENLTTLHSISYDFTDKPWDKSNSASSIITVDCDFHYPGQMGHERLSPTVVVQVSNSNGNFNSGNWGYTSVYNAGGRLTLHPVASFFGSDLSTGHIINTPIYPVNNKINITIYSGFLAKDAGNSTIYYISSPTTFEIDVEKNPSGTVVNTPESSGGNEPVNPELPTEFPTMDEDNARAFLGFIYNDPEFKTADLSDFPDYLLLTGQYRGSEQELAIRTQVFLNMVQASIDRYIEDSNVCKEYLLSSLRSHLEDSISGHFQDKFKDGLSDSVGWLGSHLTDYTGWVDDLGSLLIAAEKITDTWSAVEFLVENSPSIIQGILLPLESELSGRYTYFNEYLRNRYMFGEKDNPAFETIMEYIAFALRENNWLGGFISWIPGVASWYESREMIDDWAEYTYQLHIYVQYEKHSASFTNNYSIIQVQCPVDVQIFDDHSTKVAETSQNEIIHPVPENLQTELMLYVAGDTKLIIVNEPSKYNLRLIASEDGKFNYICSNIDENGQETIRYNTYEVPIQAQDEFISQSDLTGISSLEPDTQAHTPIPNVRIENGNSVTISILSNQEIEIVETKNYIPGDLVRLEAPQIIDLAFVGWMENGVSVSDVPIYEFTAIESRTLSAIYQDLATENPPTEDGSGDSSSIYTITFDTQIPSGTKLTATTDKDGRLSGLPTPPYWYGHEFIGWYTAPVGGMEVILDNVFTKDTIVYAHWTEVPAPTPEQTYTVTIIPTPNGTVNIDKTEVVAGDTVDITAISAMGYTVDTITVTTTDGMSVPVTNHSFTMPASNVTVTVTFKSTDNNTDNPGGGGSSSGGGGGSNSSTSHTVSVEQGDGGTIRINPSRAGRGETVNITVDPDSGYELDRITVTDSRGNTIDVERRSDTRYTFEMPSSRVTVNATFTEINKEPTPEPTVLPFTDVSASAWYYDAVRFVYERGMMAGTGNNQFSPNFTTTRAMIVTILYRLENQPAASSSSFTDVPAGQWYTNAVAWAVANGIVVGYGDGRFGPNNTITREQMATILYRYAQFKGYDVSNTGNLSDYTDAGQVGIWAQTAMGWANAQGLITGDTATTLNPTGSATRAEVATILMRYVDSVTG